jgi:hypothetical protein
MKKIVLILMLTLIANAAMAAWTRIATSGDKNQSRYIDESTYLVKGDTITFRELLDFKDPQTYSKYDKNMQPIPIKVYSELFMTEVKCSPLSSRFVSSESFSKNMLGGKSVGKLDTPTQPFFVATANSMAGAVATRACAYKDGKLNTPAMSGQPTAQGKIEVKGPSIATGEEVVRACSTWIRQASVLNGFSSNIDYVEFLPTRKASEINKAMELVTKGDVTPVKIVSGIKTGKGSYLGGYLYRDAFSSLQCTQL